MLKQLFITNEKGFILPSITFIILILFTVFLANLTTYELELELGKQYVEQIKIETLIQLGIDTYKDDLINCDSFIKQQTYSFPNGEVLITATENLNEQLIMIKLQISTDKNHHYRADFAIPLQNYQKVVDSL